ncbi:MAG: hypothetical protein ABJB22_06075 [Verrucomicrobiota bacterium]
MNTDVESLAVASRPLQHGCGQKSFSAHPCFIRVHPWLILLVAVIGCGGSIPAEELPGAAQVASKIGEDVKFGDVVKAVSKSRTHDGFYLSFGAPYPQQVLTVWVPSDVFETLPGKGALIDRRVRIRGILQKTDTGPMLGLEAPDQIELLPADESILSQLRLGGATERKEFAAAVRQHLDREDFETIEVLGRELQESRERFIDGGWLLDALFLGFKLDSDAPNEIYEKRAQVITHWRARYPGSMLPILAEVAFHVDTAWKWRGIGFAPTVSKEGWKNFKHELAAARQILEDHPEAKAAPAYFNEMHRIAVGQHWPRKPYFELFSEAISREPEYYGFYISAARYLLPRWYGKKGEWEKFAEEQRGKRGGTEGDILYTRIAWAMEPYYRNHLFDKTAVSWETMAAGFAALMQQHPDSRFLKNVYAHFAWEARDRVRLRPALEAIKDHPDMEVWVNLENVQFAEKFAKSEPSLR